MDSLRLRPAWASTLVEMRLFNYGTRAHGGGGGLGSRGDAGGKPGLLTVLPGALQMRAAPYFSCSYLLLHLAGVHRGNYLEQDRGEASLVLCGSFCFFPASTKDFLGPRHHKLDQQRAFC